MLAAPRTIMPMAWNNERIQSGGRIQGLCLSFALAEPCRSFATLRSNASRKTLGNPNS